MTASAPLPVIVNRSGGTASAKGDALGDAIEQAFADAGQSITLELVEGKDIAKETAFATAFKQLRNRISLFLALPLQSIDRLALRSQLQNIGTIGNAVSRAS